MEKKEDAFVSADNESRDAMARASGTQAPAEETEDGNENSTSANLKVAAVFMLSQVVCLCYVTMQSLLKDLQVRANVTVCEISFLRTFFQMFGSVIVLLICKKNPFTSVQKELAFPLLVRCLAGSFAFIVVTKTLMYLPLTIFQVMNNMTPFVVAILALVWLGENIPFFQVVAMTCCFGGILMLLLAKPDEEAPSEGSVMTDYQKGITLATVAVFCFALGNVVTRRVRGIHFSVIQFYLALVGFVISSIWMLIERDGSGQMLQLGGAIPWVEVFAASYLHFTAQIIQTCLNQSLNPATVGIFMYLQTVYAYFIDFFFFDERLKSLQYVGASIIMVFAVSTAVHKRYKDQLKKEEEEACKEKNKVLDDDGFQRK